MPDTADTKQSTTTDVQAFGGPLPLSVPAREKFDQRSIDLILRSVAPQLNDQATLYRFVEIAARYELDPFTGEIWLANMAGRNGGGSRFTILVGRDGYMKVAKRDTRFVSCTGQPVYENDHFDVELISEDRGYRVQHKPAHPARRGKPLGAYATLIRRGLPTLYFFADLKQFRKQGGAWQYEDAMIVKCAVSYLLRTTYGVSGPTPADEVDAGFTPPGQEPAQQAAAAGPSLDALPERVRDLFAQAADLDRLSWRLPEVLARITGPGGVTLDDEVRRLERDLIQWLGENKVTDAVVVDDGPSEAPPAPRAEQSATPAGEEVLTPSAADVVADPNERYRTDPEWRTRVDALLSSLLDVLGEGGELPADPLMEATARQLMQELENAGVPRGWMPPEDGDPAPAEPPVDASPEQPEVPEA